MAENLTPAEAALLHKCLDALRKGVEAHRRVPVTVNTDPEAAESLRARGFVQIEGRMHDTPIVILKAAGITALAEHVTAERFKGFDASMSRNCMAIPDSVAEPIDELAAIVRELHRRVVELENRS